MRNASKARAIRIAITAMGGQGGGVLSNWIVRLGEESGFIVQATSVPGVAQRTGATVYYIEMFPAAAAKQAGKSPILALMPSPGDVDIVIAAELMEAGRAVKRGFVTKQTTLIASTHRDYAISEKVGLGDARQDGARVLSAAQSAAGVFVGADMAEAAAQAGTVISAVLFGALAGSGALPIDRAQFEKIIQKMGRAVEDNLHGFHKGFAVAKEGAVVAPDRIAAVSSAPEAAPAVAPLISRMRAQYPAPAHYVIREGMKRLVDFQDVRYAADYLDRLAQIHALDKAQGGERRDFMLTQAVAKHLALWMSYDDVIRVADLKTRKSRYSRFRDDVRAEDGQIVEMREYMHPRVEEICDILPTPLATFILRNDLACKIVKACLGEGRRVSTTKLRGFAPLYLLARLRFMRRAGYRNRIEQDRIAVWLGEIEVAADADYTLALSIAAMQRLIKGYGETHARGLGNFNKIMKAMAMVKAAPVPARALDDLVAAALKDEEGAALQASLDILTRARDEAA